MGQRILVNRKRQVKGVLEHSLVTNVTHQRHINRLSIPFLYFVYPRKLLNARKITREWNRNPPVAQGLEETRSGMMLTEFDFAPVII